MRSATISALLIFAPVCFGVDCESDLDCPDEGGCFPDQFMNFDITDPFSLVASCHTPCNSDSDCPPGVRCACARGGPCWCVGTLNDEVTRTSDEKSVLGDSQTVEERVQGGTLALTYKDCGAQHGQVTDIQPTSFHTGASVTITGTGTSDEDVTSAHFTGTVSALGVKLGEFSSDGTEDIVINLPMGAGKISMKALPFPFQKGTVSIPVEVKTSRFIPASLTNLDVHLEGEDQNGESVICLDVHTAKAMNQEVKEGDDTRISLIPGKIDLNRVCYECPDASYAEMVAKRDPLVKFHKKVSGGCADQGFAKALGRDPVFRNAMLFRKGAVVVV